jgi:hypothetical protein
LQFTTSSFYNVCTELRCTREHREPNSFVPQAVAPGAFFCSQRAGTVLFPQLEQPLTQLLLLPQHRDEHLLMMSFS